MGSQHKRTIGKADTAYFLNGFIYFVLLAIIMNLMLNVEVKCGAVLESL
jgi:hypothetical protein